VIGGVDALSNGLARASSPGGLALDAPLNTYPVVRRASGTYSVASGPPATRRRQARTAQGRAVGARLWPTLLLPRGGTMPCHSWLVNARSRGVRGSGPPGFRRGLDATDRAWLLGLARGPNRYRLGLAFVSARRCVPDALARQLSRFRATPWPQIETVRRRAASRRGTGETAQASRAGRRFVRLTPLYGVDRTPIESASGGCAFSPVAMGCLAPRRAPKRKNRCSPDEVRRGALKAVRGPNSCRRGLRAEDPRIYRPLMAWRPSLGT
jgi:hypothetical protein